MHLHLGASNDPTYFQDTRYIGYIARFVPSMMNAEAALWDVHPACPRPGVGVARGGGEGAVEGRRSFVTVRQRNLLLISRGEQGADGRKGGRGSRGCTTPCRDRGMRAGGGVGEAGGETMGAADAWGPIVRRYSHNREIHPCRRTVPSTALFTPSSPARAYG